MGKLIEELKRRKVFRVAAVYAVVAWVLIQVADTVLPALQMPQWTVSFVTILFILGFLPTLIAAWAYEVTPAGVKSDAVAQNLPVTSINSVQPINYVILAIVLLVAGFQIADRILGSSLQNDLEISSRLADTASGVLRASLVLNEPLIGANSGGQNVFTFTSDGSVLYYTRTKEFSEDTRQLIKRNLATQQENLIFEADTQIWPRISPSQDRLLLSIRDGFVITSLDGEIIREISAVKRNGPSHDWLSDDEILYSGLDNIIHKLSISSALDEKLTASDTVGFHYFPHALPGGKAFLYLNNALGVSNNQLGINVFDFESNTSKVLIEDSYYPTYIPTGHIAFVRSGDLWIVPFDSDSLELLGPPVRSISGVSSHGLYGAASYGISQKGRLAFLLGEEYLELNEGLSFTNASGDKEVIALPLDQYEQFELSPDESTLAFVIVQPDGTNDIWVYDLERGTRGKRTFTGDARRPKWTPDGTQLVYQKAGEGIWIVNSDGTGATEQIASSPTARPASFDALTGNLFYLDGVLGSANIKVLSLNDAQWISSPLIESRFNTWGATVSPDGNWIAYSSSESGVGEIYVSPYPDLIEGRRQVSSNTGREPRWSTDGRTLYYLQLEGNSGGPLGIGTLMSVRVDDGGEIAASPPSPILDNLFINSNYPPNYAVLDNGETFIRYTQDGDTEDSVTETSIYEISIVENWFEEVMQLAPHTAQ